MGNALAKLGCLTILVCPIVAAIAYPRLNWLFWVSAVAFGLFIAFAILDRIFGKDPKPAELAQSMEGILNRSEQTWDIDAFESYHLRDPHLKELRAKALAVGSPETWHRKSDEERAALRKIVDELRKIN